MVLSPCLAVRRVRKNDLGCAVLQTLEQDVEDVQVKVGKVRKKGKVKGKGTLQVLTWLQNSSTTSAAGALQICLRALTELPRGEWAGAVQNAYKQVKRDTHPDKLSKSKSYSRLGSLEWQRSHTYTYHMLITFLLTYDKRKQLHI